MNFIQKKISPSKIVTIHSDFCMQFSPFDLEKFPLSFAYKISSYFDSVKFSHVESTHFLYVCFHAICAVFTIFCLKKSKQTCDRRKSFFKPGQWIIIMMFTNSQRFPIKLSKTFLLFLNIDLYDEETKANKNNAKINKIKFHFILSSHVIPMDFRNEKRRIRKKHTNNLLQWVNTDGWMLDNPQPKRKHL